MNRKKNLIVAAVSASLCEVAAALAVAWYWPSWKSFVFIAALLMSFWALWRVAKGWEQMKNDEREIRG